MLKCHTPNFQHQIVARRILALCKDERKFHLQFQENSKESVQATNRLMKELRDVYRSKMYKNHEYTVELVDDSLYNWNVMLRSIDADSDLYKDLQELKKRDGTDGILFNIKFDANYPFEVPFVRIVYPVIEGKYHKKLLKYKKNNFSSFSRWSCLSRWSFMYGVAFITRMELCLYN